jgi:hypothetical protein
MALRKDYRVTDDDGHFDDVAVSLDYDEGGNPFVAIAAPGADLKLTFSMSREIIQAIQSVMEDEGK